MQVQVVAGKGNRQGFDVSATGEDRKDRAVAVAAAAALWLWLWRGIEGRRASGGFDRGL